MPAATTIQSGTGVTPQQVNGATKRRAKSPSKSDNLQEPPIKSVVNSKSTYADNKQEGETHERFKFVKNAELAERENHVLKSFDTICGKVVEAYNYILNSSAGWKGAVAVGIVAFIIALTIVPSLIILSSLAYIQKYGYAKFVDDVLYTADARLGLKFPKTEYLYEPKKLVNVAKSEANSLRTNINGIVNSSKVPADKEASKLFDKAAHLVQNPSEIHLPPPQFLAKNVATSGFVKQTKITSEAFLVMIKDVLSNPFEAKKQLVDYSSKTIANLPSPKTVLASATKLSENVKHKVDDVVKNPQTESRKGLDAAIETGKKTVTFIQAKSNRWLEILTSAFAQIVLWTLIVVNIAQRAVTAIRSQGGNILPYVQSTASKVYSNVASSLPPQIRSFIPVAH